MNDKRRDQIGSVKPLGTPIFDRIDQVVIKKLDFETLAKLNPATAEGTGFLTAGLRFQAKEKAKKRERRRDPKEGFTKMNKNRKMENSIGG